VSSSAGDSGWRPQASKLRIAPSGQSGILLVLLYESKANAISSPFEGDGIRTALALMTRVQPARVGLRRTPPGEVGAACHLPPPALRDSDMTHV